MARLTHQLTETKIRALTEVGMYHDGAGLYLQIRPHAQSWIYRFRLNGRTRDMGLGALADIALVRAREKAAAARTLVAQGIDPIAHVRAQRSSLRHRNGIYLRPSKKSPRPTWLTGSRLRSEIHRHQWRQTLVDYAYPIIGKMPVNEIETNDVLAVLRPIWETECETAARLRGRIERILARAGVLGLRTGANCAVWRGHLQEALPPRSQVAPVVHFRALPFSEIPALMNELCQISTISAVALRFLILTAARTNEVLGARWSEVNWTERTWVVPNVRAKSNRDHIIPLSTGALAALREVEPLRGVSGDFIFPGSKGSGLSSTTLLVLLQRQMKRAAATVHGFGSCFRDWAGDEAGVPAELAEAALAHVVKNKVEAAYRRGTAIARRAAVMQQWSDYCLPPSTTVVDIAQARHRSTAA